jgi:hypothetical protein
MTSKSIALLLLLGACGTVDVDVIRLPPGSQFDGGVPTSCSDFHDCAGDQLCDKAACADALGHCAPRPSASVCPSDYRPECGCNGVTYWNGCLRRAAGVESHEVTECTRTCDAASPCPDGALCARLLHSPTDCSRAAAGACFALPLSCEGGPPNHYVPCDNLSQCLDMCAAIRSGQTSFEQTCL